MVKRWCALDNQEGTLLCFSYRVPNQYWSRGKIIIHYFPSQNLKKTTVLNIVNFQILIDMQWFFLDKNGKRCHMLSGRAAFVNDVEYPSSWQSLPKSRFILFLSSCQFSYRYMGNMRYFTNCIHVTPPPGYNVITDTRVSNNNFIHPSPFLEGSTT